MSLTTTCATNTSVIPFPILDSSCTRSSATAAGPLPYVPCRSARSSPPLSDTSPSDSSISKTESAGYTPQSRSAVHVRSNSGSSLSSFTLSDEIRPIIISHSKCVASQFSTLTDSRDIFTPITPGPTPVKQSADVRPSSVLGSRKQTPLCDTSDEDTLRPFPVLKQTPFRKFGKLRLEGSTRKHAHLTPDSDDTLSPAPVSGTPNAKQPPQTIRKKSGQPVKSSLKSARRPELHVVTDSSFAKSEPATPTHAKAVKFDSKLEHVKLFLAKQKPLAVSRDGSPTSDISSDEFPSFIYGDGNCEDQQVKMLVPNMPASPRKGKNVALQGLTLSQDQRTITGTVHVRNIAYEKWLAVRFTLDEWQTTSEVTARYRKPVGDDVFDVFTFTFRLHDIWSRIEEKAIFFALRYAVAGREYWDNNAGQNYHIKFVLSPPSAPLGAVDNEVNLRSLELKLEDLAKAKSAPIPITPYRLGRSFSADHQYSSFARPLPTRYDFALAHKTQWLRNVSPQPNRHTRTRTHPCGTPSTAGATVAPWSGMLSAQETKQVTSPQQQQQFPLPIESSREAMGDTLMPPLCSETKLAQPVSPSSSHLQDGRERNHRRGYIDKAMEGSHNLRRTQAGSPLKFDATDKVASAQLPRTRSFPLITGIPGPMVNSPRQSTIKPSLSIETAPVGDGGNQEPTPCEASQSSSSSTPCSPLYSPGPDCTRSETSYKQFLDQFCFYTGADSLPHEPSETLPRSYSILSNEHSLLSNSPPQSLSSYMYDLPAWFSLEPSISAVHAQ